MQLELEQVEATTGLPRRTVQRRLAELVTAKRIEAAGRGKQRRYRAPSSEAISPAELALSDQGQIVRTLIRRPLIARAPVGYRQEFLRSYRPNVDHYLSLAIRERLERIGRAPGPERPAGTFARQLLDRLLIDLSWGSSRLEGNDYGRASSRVGGGARRNSSLLLARYTRTPSTEVGFQILGSTRAFRRHMQMRLALLLALGSMTSFTPRSALGENRSRPRGPRAFVKDRILVTQDCANTPSASKVDEDAPAVIDASRLHDVTVSLVARKQNLLLAIDGTRGGTAARTRTHSLYRGRNVEGPYPAGSAEDDLVLTAFLPEGGPSNTQFRVRLNRCFVEVLRLERDDLGNETPWFLTVRVKIAPRRSVWAI
jgi:hypothetical protein